MSKFLIVVEAPQSEKYLVCKAGIFENQNYYLGQRRDEAMIFPSEKQAQKFIDSNLREESKWYAQIYEEKRI